MKKRTIIGIIAVFVLLLLSTSLAQEDLLPMMIEEEVLEDNTNIQEELIEEPVEELQELIVEEELPETKKEEPIQIAPIPIITGKVVQPEPKNAEEAFLAAILEQLTPAEQEKVKARLKHFEKRNPLEYMMEMALQVN